MLCPPLFGLGEEGGNLNEAKPRDQLTERGKKIREYRFWEANWSIGHFHPRHPRCLRRGRLQFGIYNRRRYLYHASRATGLSSIAPEGRERSGRRNPPEMLDLLSSVIILADDGSPHVYELDYTSLEIETRVRNSEE